MLKVVLGLRTTPSQDFRANLDCVCLDFGFLLESPFMAKCVFVPPIPLFCPPNFCFNSISVDLTSSYSFGSLRYVPFPPLPIQFLLFSQRTWTTTRTFWGVVQFPALLHPRVGRFSYLHDILTPLFLFFFPFSFSLPFYLAISSTFRTEQLDWMIFLFSHSRTFIQKNRWWSSRCFKSIFFVCPNSFLVVYLVCNV